MRDSEKDSQLSYAGLRDPAGNTLSTQGQIWGGVVANQGTVQVAHGDAESGFYFAASGQYLTGYHTRSNTRIDGTGGAYWRVMASPEFGNLTLGANFFGMHYANNQNAFTHGMGGYFSPQAYFLANVPLSWQGHYGTRWHYNINGALGVQAFQEDSTPLWPLAGDKPLEVSQNNPMLPNVTSVSPNYDFHSQVAYQIHTHWFAGAYFAANNTRNYSYASVGFFVRLHFPRAALHRRSPHRPLSRRRPPPLHRPVGYAFVRALTRCHPDPAEAGEGSAVALRKLPWAQPGLGATLAPNRLEFIRNGKIGAAHGCASIAACRIESQTMRR